MKQVDRRSFLRGALGITGAAAAGVFERRAWAWAPGVRKATDVVLLGPDKVRLTRMAIGTGTKGGSIQRQLGIPGLADVLHFGYDQGLFFWETADGYKTHPHVKEALTRVPREKVAILTKTRATTAEAMKADLDRFRQELGTDYLDIVLLHALRSADALAQRQGALEALAEARAKGIVRTHGCSCHSLDALQAAVKTPGVRVVLARINPASIMMDGDPKTITGVLRDLKSAGKGVIGMKILGEGALADRKDEALRYAMSLDCLDCFTIGPGNRSELSDLLVRIPAAASALKAAA